jgi:predicted RND superfamily exporter protein
MKKVFLSIFVITLFVNFSNAKEIKSSKDSNLTISDEEFMKQWEQLEKEKKEEKDKTAKTELEQKKSKEDLKASKKLGRTLDELLNRIEGINTNERK